MAYYQGYFKPKHPQKYKGDPTQIVYRSSWELRLFSYLDAHESVKKWGSEEFFIPYKSPLDNRMHRYFPDVYVEQINSNGELKKILIEIKPEKETRPPLIEQKLTSKGNLSRKYLTEVAKWGVNDAKWKAAREYCLDRGWEFHIMTEKHLFGK